MVYFVQHELSTTNTLAVGSTKGSRRDSNKLATELSGAVESFSQLREAFALVYQKYRSENFIDSDPRGIFFSPQALDSNATTYVHVRNGRVDLTTTLILDSEDGLPADSEFSKELAPLRQQGSIAEATLFVRRDTQAPGWLSDNMRACKWIFEWGIDKGIASIVMVVHPSHAEVWTRKVGFEKISEVKRISRVKGRVGVLLRVSPEILMQSADDAPPVVRHIRRHVSKYPVFRRAEFKLTEQERRLLLDLPEEKFSSDHDTLVRLDAERFPNARKPLSYYLPLLTEEVKRSGAESISPYWVSQHLPGLFGWVRSRVKEGSVSSREALWAEIAKRCGIEIVCGVGTPKSFTERALEVRDLLLHENPDHWNIRWLRDRFSLKVANSLIASLRVPEGTRFCPLLNELPASLRERFEAPNQPKLLAKYPEERCEFVRGRTRVLVRELDSYLLENFQPAGSQTEIQDENGSKKVSVERFNEAWLKEHNKPLFSKIRKLATADPDFSWYRLISELSQDWISVSNRRLSSIEDCAIRLTNRVRREGVKEWSANWVFENEPRVYHTLMKQLPRRAVSNGSILKWEHFLDSLPDDVVEKFVGTAELKERNSAARAKAEDLRFQRAGEKISALLLREKRKAWTVADIMRLDTALGNQIARVGGRVRVEVLPYLSQTALDSMTSFRPRVKQAILAEKLARHIDSKKSHWRVSSITDRALGEEFRGYVDARSEWAVLQHMPRTLQERFIRPGVRNIARAKARNLAGLPINDARQVDRVHAILDDNFSEAGRVSGSLLRNLQHEVLTGNAYALHVGDSVLEHYLSVQGIELQIDRGILAEALFCDALDDESWEATVLATAYSLNSRKTRSLDAPLNSGEVGSLYDLLADREIR